MPLESGTVLGGFRIVGQIGAGGMGEVYRAQDTTLGREVAIKVLPDAFARDPERLNRFEREARVLASLNHPNIATLHGLKDTGTLKFLEMELVAGETLAERIARGPMPLDEMLPVFQQIAQALEAAHARGITHRDLKPANIKVTPDGRVKVLDFGIAKASEPDTGALEMSQTPTFTSAPTREGTVMGSVNYMSPEQVRGKPIDRRADVWAFGCMLFEALTGTRPFLADTSSDVLAAILREQPDWSAIANAPPWLNRLIRRCLKKDPQFRLHDIADARVEIAEAVLDPALQLPATAQGATVVEVTARRSTARVAGALAAAAIVGALATWGTAQLLRDEAVARPTRLAVTLPADHHLELGPSPAIAISPDGARLAYIATENGGRTKLFVRVLDSFATTAVAASEGASAPFFSPDGEWVGFYAEGMLHKAPVSGGTPLKIAETPTIWSASWHDDDEILFATLLAPNGLWRVQAGGGTPERLTTPDAKKDEIQHAYPQRLPGGSVLFSIVKKDGWRTAVLNVDKKEWHEIGQSSAAGVGARFVESGHVVVAQDGALVAVPFDPRMGKTSGNAIPLADRTEAAHFGGAYFAAASNGTLVYVPPGVVAGTRTLALVDLTGHASPLGDERGAFAHPRVSPDGRRVAVSIGSEGGRDIWIYDLRRGLRTRLTSGGVNDLPVWSPDGTRITFQSSGPGPWTMFAKNADGTGRVEPLIGGNTQHEQSPATAALAGLLPGTLPELTGANPQYPMSWTGDGEALAFDERKPSGERDIWLLPKGSQPSPFLVTSFDERTPRFSPDGRWLAYVSDESGRNEIYVQPYPGPGEKWPVSSGGGEDPVWAPGGRDLFFRQGQKMMAVEVQARETFSSGSPRVLFESLVETGAARANYDVTPEGDRFVMIVGDAGSAAAPLHIVLNWFEELRSKTK